MKKNIAVKIFAVTLGLFITVLILHFFIFQGFFNQIYTRSMIDSYQGELRQAAGGYLRGGPDTSCPSLRRYSAETNAPVLVFDGEYRLSDSGFMEQMSIVTLRLEDGQEVHVPIQYLFSLLDYPRLSITNRVRFSGVPLGNTGYWEPLVLVYGDRSWTNGNSYLRYGESGAAPPSRVPAVVTRARYFPTENSLLSGAATMLYDQVKDCLILQSDIDDYLARTSAEPITDLYGSQYRLLWEKLILGGDSYYFVTLRRIFFSGQESRYINSMFVIIYGVFAVLLTLSALVLSKYVSRPLARLNQAAGKLAQLDFSQPAQVRGEDELGQMARSINILSQNLQEALARARGNEERIKALLADLAHEFKTPLGIIAFYTELFEKGAYRDRPQEYYAIVDKQIGQLTQMVNEAIELSRLQSGHWSVEIDVCDLGDIVRSVLELFDKRLSSEGYTVVIEDFSLLVRADSRRMEQVLSNFMSNAYKYCDYRRTIYLGWEEAADGNVSVYVANSGILSLQERDRIWDRYYSNPGSGKARLPSEGIGLDIVRTILDSHGSRYGVSQKDGMVYFYFTLERVVEAGL